MIPPGTRASTRDRRLDSRESVSETIELEGVTVFSISRPAARVAAAGAIVAALAGALAIPAEAAAGAPTMPARHHQWIDPWDQPGPWSHHNDWDNWDSWNHYRHHHPQWQSGRFGSS